MYLFFAELELFRGYDPHKVIFDQEIELTHDLEPIEVLGSDVEAQKFKLQHNEKCNIHFTRKDLSSCIVLQMIS